MNINCRAALTISALLVIPFTLNAKKGLEEGSWAEWVDGWKGWVVDKIFTGSKGGAAHSKKYAKCLDALMNIKLKSVSGSDDTASVIWPKDQEPELMMDAATLMHDNATLNFSQAADVKMTQRNWNDLRQLYINFLLAYEPFTPAGLELVCIQYTEVGNTVSNFDNIQESEYKEHYKNLVSAYSAYMECAKSVGVVN